MGQLVAGLVVAMLLVACGASTAPRNPAPTDTSASASAPATAGATGSGSFAIAGLTASILPGGPPNPSTFATSFAKSTPVNGQVWERIAIHVSYQLAAGLTGKVRSVTVFPDGRTIEDSFDYPASALAGHFTIAHADGFALGDYQVVLTFEPTGESVTLTFAIT